MKISEFWGGWVVGNPAEGCITTHTQEAANEYVLADSTGRKEKKGIF